MEHSDRGVQPGKAVLGRQAVPRKLDFAYIPATQRLLSRTLPVLQEDMELQDEDDPLLADLGSALAAEQADRLGTSLPELGAHDHTGLACFGSNKERRE